jgi:hypothetical protein
MRILWRVFAGSLMAIGATFVAMAIGDLLTGGDGHTTTGVYAGLIVFFGAMAFGGWRIWRSTGSAASPGLRVAAEPTEFEVEQRILGAAWRAGGRVTIGEVAMACQVPIARAKQTLENMVSAGAAELLLTEGGDPVYRIGGLLDASEKQGATDPLADVLPGPARDRR